MELRPMSAAEIAERAGQPETEVFQILENLSSRGLIFSRKKGDKTFYILVPPMPGIFEFMYVKGEKSPDLDKLGKLWNQYFENALGPYMHDERGPSNLRILAVEQQVPHNLDVMPFERVSQLIEDARLIAMGNCQCRQASNNCDAPLDVCLLLDSWADYLVDRKMARTISDDEALNVLDRAEDAGLIHCTDNAKGGISFVCNCCSCCCFMLRGIVQLNLPKAVASSRYLARIDTDNCDACGLCESSCQFSAITILDTAEINDEKCYGCGLCAGECPNNAILLAPRPNYIEPPNTGMELITQLAHARGKDSFMKK